MIRAIINDVRTLELREELAAVGALVLFCGMILVVAMVIR